MLSTSKQYLRHVGKRLGQGRWLQGHVAPWGVHEGPGGRHAQLLQIVGEEAHVACAALTIVADLRAVPAHACRLLCVLRGCAGMGLQYQGQQQQSQEGLSELLPEAAWAEWPCAGSMPS